MSKRLPGHLKAPRPGAVPGTEEWTRWVQEIERELGYPICAAAGHAKRPYPCPQPQALGTRRCKSHGAKTPLGALNPAWKDGRASILVKRAPKHLAAAVKASLGDPNLMENRVELAILDARTAELWESLHQGGMAEAWETMRSLVGDLALAMAEDDQDEVHRVASAMSTTVNQHFDDARTWSEIRKTAGLRAKISGEERKRQQVLQGFIRAERVNFFMMYLVELLATNVPREYLGPIMDGIKRLNPTRELTDPVEVI